MGQGNRLCEYGLFPYVLFLTDERIFHAIHVSAFEPDLSAGLSTDQ